MEYLPILGELPSSDSIIFLFAGLTIASLVGMKWRGVRAEFGAAVSFVIYAACEALSNLRANNLVELALLFIGTAAIGSFFGYLIGIIASKAKGYSPGS